MPIEVVGIGRVGAGSRWQRLGQLFELVEVRDRVERESGPGALHLDELHPAILEMRIWGVRTDAGVGCPDQAGAVGTEKRNLIEQAHDQSDPDAVLDAVLAMMADRGPETGADLTRLVHGLPPGLHAELVRLTFARLAGGMTDTDIDPDDPLMRLRFLLTGGPQIRAGLPDAAVAEIVRWFERVPYFHPDVRVLLILGGYAERNGLPAELARYYAGHWWTGSEHALAGATVDEMRTAQRLMANLGPVEDRVARFRERLTTCVAGLDALAATQDRSPAELFDAILAVHGTPDLWKWNGAVYDAVRTVVAAQPDAVRDELVALLFAAEHPSFDNVCQSVLAGVEAAGGLSGAGIQTVLAWAGRQWHVGHVHNELLELAERGPLPPLALAPLRRMAVSALGQGYDEYGLEDGTVEALPGPPLNPGEAWSDLALADLDAMDADERAAWLELLDGSRTGPATLDQAGAERLRAWLAAVPAPRTVEIGDRCGLDEWNARVLRGLVALAPARDDLAGPLAGVVEAALRKGPSDVKLANAAVDALAGIGSDEARAQLAWLDDRVTDKRVRKRIEQVAVRSP